MFGGVGNDRLDGGTGDDVLTGDTGADMFVYDIGSGGTKNQGTDTITDFADGTDLIEVRRGAFEDLIITTVGGNTEVSFTSGTLIIIEGVTSGIDVADFIFV
ncbi:MAG: hypothetical protein GY949_12585 [Gammaproteobacteria bacterium]|nr:hypothetical protein [Gammaproteobacteria bacterium]